MRVLTVLALLGCLCACGGPEPAKVVDATRALRPHIEKVNAAWTSLDVAKVAPFYAKEDGRPFYDVKPLKYSSWAAYAAGFRDAAVDVKSLKFEIHPDFQASSDGSIAWATFTGTVRAEMKDGTKDQAEVRVTQVLQKDKDSWLILHEHASVPMAEPAAPAPVAKAAAKKSKARKAGAKKKARRR